METIVLILLVCSFFPDDINGITEDVGHECDSDSECLPSNDCQYLQDQKAMIKELTDRDQKIKLIKKLKEGICNQKERAFCCPKEKEEPFEAEFENCGTPQVVVSNVNILLKGD